MTEPAAQPAPEPRTPDPEPAVNPDHGRSLTGFYVVICILLALVCLGTWLWTLIPKWPFDAGEARRRQVEASERLGLPVEKVVDLGAGVVLELVLIPAGRFRMGSPADDPDRSNNETLRWAVLTQPFYIGKYQVTQEVWEKVMGANPSKFKGAKNPVECVSWDDCQEFLKKLNGLGKEPGQFRLPTEAQWEWACRAGTKSRFCFGDDASGLADYAWYEDNSGGTTHPVGAKKPNAWGLFDMHGNVFDWCGDWYEDYPADWMPKYDPVAPATGSRRALRGGSWAHRPDRCRSAGRGGIPGYGDPQFGLRLSLAVPGPRR